MNIPPFQMNNNTLPNLGRNWNKLLLTGILFCILGILAITFSTFTTVVSVVFLGTLLTIGGILIIYDAFHSWYGKTREFLPHLIMGILYLVTGLFMISGPISASISLTLILAIFYIVIGMFRIFNALTSTQPKTSWGLLNGVISLLLGILIMAGWPSSGLVIIGLFVGIDLIFFGLAYVMLALNIKNHRKSLN